MEKKINLSQLIALREFAEEYSDLGDNYVFSRLTSSKPCKEYLDKPMRVEGITTILCMKGHINMEVNLESFELRPLDLMFIGRDSILHITDVDWSSLDCYLFVVSNDFLRNVNFDINVVNQMPISPQRASVLQLSYDEVTLIRRYLDLVHYNTKENSDPMYVRTIARSLIAALVYQLMQFVRNRPAPPDNQYTPSRRSNYVHEFITLLHAHHRQERSVAFYASKLFISPKYLSLIIKEMTGRSAAEWIDEFVILEAKNMLRFSGKNVQQIAYDLNFANQSSFGKYFKHLTGMSPTQFQHS